MTRTHLNMLFGFLGSGKTTLAKRILTEYGPKRQLALLVNEFGDVGVDGDILAGNNIDVVQLSSGCLCCTLKGSMQAAVIELADNHKIDHIIIEATGVAEPEDVLASFAEPDLLERFEIGPVVTVVDTPKFEKIRGMLGPFYEAQVANADFIILNKVDASTGDDVEGVKKEVLDINPDAIVRISEHCDVNLEEVLDGTNSAALQHWIAEHGSDHGHDHNHHDHHDHDHGHAPAESFVVDLPALVDRNELTTLYSQAPDTLWRSKGFVRLKDNKDYLVQVAMGAVEITPTEPRDRHYLVFIGDKLDEKFFRSRLNDAMEVVPSR